MASFTMHSHKIKAIIIGASAGGIRALLTILAPLPPTYQLPIIIVLHLPHDRDSKLIDVFQYHCSLPVREAQDKEKINAGTLYFAGSGYHLSIERDFSFSLSCEEPVCFARPAIDVLMQSAADAYGQALAGFLLTGANHDGAEGLACIKALGGLTVVQDPNEAEIPHMPQAAINRQEPDMILSLTNIHALLVDLESCK
jgi:two-component system chemotaxis response regulator CheB